MDKLDQKLLFKRLASLAFSAGMLVAPLLLTGCGGGSSGSLISTLPAPTSAPQITPPPVTVPRVNLIGLSSGNRLVMMDSISATTTNTVTVTGVDQALIGIDVRPANGLLYGLNIDSRLFTINTTTGVATPVSTLSTPFTAGIQSGMDFNPVPNLLRIVGSNRQNLRVDVDTGMVRTGDLPLRYSDPNKLTSITGAAYTNNFAGATATQLFVIDFSDDTLVLQNPPNDGTLTTVGPLGVDVGATVGFDIFTGRDGTNTAFALMGSTLYTINLTTGAATPLGSPGNGPYLGLAALPGS